MTYQLVMIHRDGRETAVYTASTYTEAECEGRNLCFWLPEEYAGYRVVEVWD